MERTINSIAWRESKNDHGNSMRKVREWAYQELKETLEC